MPAFRLSTKNGKKMKTEKIIKSTEKRKNSTWAPATYTSATTMRLWIWIVRTNFAFF